MEWFDKEVLQVLFLLAWVLFSQLRRSALKRRQGPSAPEITSATPSPKPSRPDIFKAPVPAPVFVEMFDIAEQTREYRPLEPIVRGDVEEELVSISSEAPPAQEPRESKPLEPSSAGVLRDALILDALFFRRPGRPKGF